MPIKTALLASLFLLPVCAVSAQGWTGSWAASQQIPEPNNALPDSDLDHAILRQIVHLSLGGSAIRIHISNAFGHQPLAVTSVHAARPVSPAGSAIVAGSDHLALFGGQPEVLIPAGAEYLSDPIAMPAAAFSDLAITIETSAPPSVQTGHPGSRATSYVTHGVPPDTAELPGAKSVEHWYFLSGVDVATAPSAAAIVALGDSITDGHAATTNGNDRWPDDLAKRLRSSSLSVLNQGIGGNHILTDGLGPNALARFDRDVLAQSGVRFVIVLEGVNDLGGSTINGDIPAAAHDALVARLLAAYTQIIERAHAHGLTIYGGTITPYVGNGYYHAGPASEADRIRINAWIRKPGHFDGVIDFAAAVADPQHPEKLLPAYDCGDHLHPSPAGYKAMADAVPLSLFNTSAKKEK